jgi:dTDP-4-amino-4,6-dideoxygalactose transaminase
VIRLTVPSIEEDDLLAVREALLSGYLVQGARVSAFEQAVAEYVGSEYAVAVSSGTAALHLGFRPIPGSQLPMSSNFVAHSQSSWIFSRTHSTSIQIG